MATRVYFRVPIFGTTEMIVTESVAVIDALAVAANTANTTVGGATGRMVVLTEQRTGLPHKVRADEIAGYVISTDPDHV